MWAQLGLAGLSALSGLLNGRPRTTTTEQTSTNSGSSSNSGSTRRYLTDEQQQQQALLGSYSANRLMDPMAGITDLLAPQRNAVNSAYAGMPQRIADATLAHGGSMSGKYLRGVRQAEMGRASALTDVAAQAPALAQAREQQAAALLMSLLGMNMGADETGSSQFSQTGTSRGTQTGGGNMAGGAVDGLGGILGLLFGMRKPGGGGTPGGGLI